MRSAKGITLIALVITIIVMLILAGTVINLTIGENGIISRAQQAGRDYINAQEKEIAELNNFSNLILGDSKDIELNPIVEKYYTVGFKLTVPDKIQGDKYIFYVGKNSYESIERTMDILDLEPNQQYDIQIGALGKNGNVVQLSNKINAKTFPRKKIIL